MMVAKTKIQEAGAASRDIEQDSKRCYSSTLEQSIQAWQAKRQNTILQNSRTQRPTRQKKPKKMPSLGATTTNPIKHIPAIPTRSCKTLSIRKEPSNNLSPLKPYSTEPLPPALVQF
jgi:hypothetical protein